jgi:OOP family OmpA-OmpF porin
MRFYGVGCWLVLIFSPVLVQAQTPANTLCSANKKAIALYVEADNYRVRGQFKQAMELLNQAIQKDKNFCEAYYRLAQVYRDTRKIKEAIDLMNKGLSLTTDPKKEKIFHFDLAELSLLTGNYADAKKYATLFLAQEKTNKPKIDEATLWLKTSEYGLTNQREANDYLPRMLSDTVNSFVMQYFPVLTADEQQLFFTRRNGITGYDTEDIVVSTKDAQGRWTKPVSVSPIINSPENEGTCSVSADGRQIIFTSCRGRAGFGGCDLFMSEKKGDEWSTPVNLGAGVNSGYWESQPSLSADGRVLYFASERRGGRGGKDIYVSYKDDKGVWSKAEMLPATINSPIDDLSPFIHANGRTLFFASNGRVGFGGYDIYVTERIDNAWTEPKNFGAPVNNFEDQFSLFITADGKTGYYSHERDLNENTGRLYEIKIPEALQMEHRSNYVKGIITDIDSKQPVKARIELMDLKKNALVSVVSSDSLNGKYLMVLTHGSDYGLFVSAPGYLYKSFNFNYEQLNQFDPIIADIALQRAKSGAMVVLNNIFFDYNKFDLKAESISELEKVVRFLTDNPKTKIEISGHTDNQGNEDSNQVLSQKRAASVSDYLAQKGILASRVKTMGFGSKKPLLDNSTEENRKVNRRIEFRILE